MYYLVLLTGFTFQLFNKKALLYIFALLLTLMASFRYGIGIDYFAYEYLYNMLQPSVLNEIKFGFNSQEVGFRVIGSFFKSIGLTYQQYIMFFAVANIFFIVQICRKYSRNPTLSLLIFFCFYYLTWTFSGIRQGFVIAVGLYYLLRCIERNQTVKFILITFLLSLIHSSALVLLVLYFVSKFDFNKNKLILLSIASIILSIIPTGYLISKLTWLPLYSRIYPYLNAELSLNLFDFQGFGRVLFLIIAFVYYNQYCKQNEISKKIINMYIISIILYFVLQFSELTAARLSIYGKFLDIIILANILYLYKSSINRLIYTFGIFFLCFIYLFKVTDEIDVALTSNTVITPYVSIFNKENYNFSSMYRLLVND